MKQAQVVSVLNQLHAMERFSLENYLRSSQPWFSEESRPLYQSILQIADQQQENANRIVALLSERGGSVDGCTFPARFASYNDLSLDYLVWRVLEDEEGILGEFRECAEALAGDGEAQTLALEILESGKVRWKNLKQLVGDPQAETGGVHDRSKPLPMTETERFATSSV